MNSNYPPGVNELPDDKLDEKNILLMDIFSLSMKIQDETSYGIFVDFSGHIDQIEVRVTKTKTDYLERVITFDAYTDSDEYSFTEEDAISDLKEMRDDVEMFYEQAVHEVSTRKEVIDDGEKPERYDC